MSEWTDAETAVAEVIWTASRADESTISATGANHVARAVLASGVVVPARVVEATEQVMEHNRKAADRAEAELSRFRSAVEALVAPGCTPDGEPLSEWVHADELRRLLTEGRDRAREGAGS